MSLDSCRFDYLVNAFCRVYLTNENAFSIKIFHREMLSVK